MRLVWVLLRAVALLLVLGVSGIHAAEDDTIRIGILHSLSGTMAISESVLKDTVLMMIADQNRRGGLLGKKLEPVVVDPASNGTPSPKRPASCSRRRRSRSYSAAGRRCPESRFYRSLSN